MNETCASNSNTGNKFKQISLGPKAVMIPSEWEVRSIKNLTVDEKFAIVDGPFGTQLHADEYVSEGYPLVRISNLSFNGKFIKDKLAFVQEEKIRELNRSKIVPGDIIIAKTGATIGKNAIFPDDFDKGLIASSCLKISIDQNLSNTKFVHYWINSTFGQDLIDLYSSGTTRKSINIEPFGEIKIPNPPLAEQRRIAEILSTVDELIHQTDAIIEETERLKRGLMQDLFINGIYQEDNYLVHVGAREYEIPNSWRVVKAADVCEEITVGIVSGATEHYSESGIPFIRTKNVTQNGICPTDMKYISSNFHQHNLKSELNAGDVITARTGDPGTTCIVPPEYDGANCFSLLISRMGNEILNKYFCYYMNSLYTSDFINSRKGGGVQKNLNVGSLRNLPIILPDIPSQIEIVRILEQIDSKRKSEKNFKKNINSLKFGLMQDLLTGKVRVPVET